MASRLATSCAMLLLAPAQAQIRVLNHTVVDELREKLLDGIDSATPPTTTNGAGVKVGFQLKIFKVLEVDMSSGKFIIKVWRRMAWTDPRLQWNASEHHGVTEIIAYPGRLEGSLDDNIWVPDLMLYNAIRPQSETMEVGAAWIYNTGEVFHSAPGTLEVTCRFTGLVQFPHDNISCPMEFGSWSYSDRIVNTTLYYGNGVDISNLNPSSGTTYQQFQLDSAEAYRKTQTYKCCGDDEFSEVVIRVWMHRTSRSYMMLLEVPGVLLTLLSFLVLWLDVTQCGERLSFGATLFLGNLLLMQIVSSVTPLCGEFMWIELFNWCNTGYCGLTMVESIVAINIAFGGIGTVREAAAEKVDYWARRIIPITYICTMLAVAQVDFDDGYLDTTVVAPMFQGLAPHVEVNWGMAVLAPAIIIGLATLKMTLDAITGAHKRMADKTVRVAKLAMAKNKSGLHLPNLPKEADVFDAVENEADDERKLMRDLLQGMQGLVKQNQMMLDIQLGVNPLGVQNQVLPSLKSDQYLPEHDTHVRHLDAKLSAHPPTGRRAEAVFDVDDIGLKVQDSTAYGIPWERPAARKNTVNHNNVEGDGEDATATRSTSFGRIGLRKAMSAA